MAIAEMRKLNLIAMSYDKDRILDALQQTGAVEITLHTDTENTFVPAVSAEHLREELAAVESALEILTASVSTYESDRKLKLPPEKDGFLITCQQFLDAKNTRDERLKTVSEIGRLTSERQALKAALNATEKGLKTAKPYACLTRPFSYYASTAKTVMRLGILPTSATESALTALDGLELTQVQTLATLDDGVLVLVVSHKQNAAEADGILSSLDFSVCPYQGEQTGEINYADLLSEQKSIQDALLENEEGMYALKGEIKPLKLYADHLTFALEKEETGEKLRATERTFFLEAYVPEEQTKKVEESIASVSKATYVCFSLPADDETPPTLLKNNGVVSNFEGITNTYSPPNYREFDPNAVMSFFYALFMGFIIGDAGYGVLMMLAGGFVWWKNRAYPTGTSRLAGAFAFAGIFALLWGGLFNSFFGLALLPYTVMPDPQSGRCQFVGIEVPSVLVFCLVIGILHLCVGYLCKAYQNFRRKNIGDGIFDGLLWAIFSIGVGMAVVGLVKFEKYPLDFSYLTPIGGIMAGVSLLLAVLTAGRHEKLLGKFTKGFGALYGVINYASDIVSYARLYGLMLSGAVVAQIITNAVVSFFASGNVGLMVLGVVLMVGGHVFNLVISLLGAYIHDARLQYVEFYGRFYEGEGELFRPIGSSQKYVRLMYENS